jgi:hypothetical protein
MTKYTKGPPQVTGHQVKCTSSSGNHLENSVALCIWGRIQRKTWCMGPFAGVDYNLTSCPLQSRLQHIYHGQPYARVDLNPMPELTSICQSRLYPPSQGLWIWPLVFLKTTWQKTVYSVYTRSRALRGARQQKGYYRRGEHYRRGLYWGAGQQVGGAPPPLVSTRVPPETITSH